MLIAPTMLHSDLIHAHPQTVSFAGGGQGLLVEEICLGFPVSLVEAHKPNSANDQDILVFMVRTIAE